ncbi:uncharacterized protein LOC144100358 [Amblyomma americanum]
MSAKQHGGGGHYSRYLACLGVACPLLLSPMLFQESQESRCCFCLATVSILQLTEALPPPIMALLPLFVFSDLEATPSTDVELTVRVGGQRPESPPKNASSFSWQEV